MPPDRLTSGCFRFRNAALPAKSPSLATDNNRNDCETAAFPTCFHPLSLTGHKGVGLRRPRRERQSAHFFFNIIHHCPVPRPLIVPFLYTSPSCRSISNRYVFFRQQKPNYRTRLADVSDALSVSKIYSELDRSRTRPARYNSPSYVPGSIKL